MGQDTVPKKRANVVNTDYLREKVKVNYVEITKSCVKSHFLGTALSQL